LRLVLAALLLGGCTLYEYKPDEDGPGPGPDGGGGGGGPIGRFFFVDRQSTASDPLCPAFSSRDQSHTVDVDGPGMVRVDGTFATNTTVRSQPAREGIDAPNVIFTIDEVWSAPEGDAFPNINYQMFVDEFLFTGKASTAFQFESPPTGLVTCDYSWSFEGSN
jgi:hypothetical protein